MISGLSFEIVIDQLQRAGRKIVYAYAIRLRLFFEINLGDVLDS